MTYRLFVCANGHWIMSLHADTCACGSPLAEMKQATIMDRASEFVGAQSSTLPEPDDG